MVAQVSEGVRMTEAGSPTFNNVTLADGGRVKYSTANGLTALAGGGQTGATLLAADINRFTTVGTAADSAILPVSVAGMVIEVINSGANSMTVYPAVGETINALSANTGLAVAAGKTISFVCPVAGKFFGLLSA